jgi:DNA-binding MarR family transcriptional regulator
MEARMSADFDPELIEKIDRIMNAFKMAKEVHNLLPPLPAEVKPIYIRILDALRRIRGEGGEARVSDINKTLGLKLPNTTRYIGKLADLGIVEKNQSDADKRVVLVKATPLGEKYISELVLLSYQQIAEECSISDADIETMIDTIRKLYIAIKRITKDRDDANEH